MLTPARQRGSSVILVTGAVFILYAALFIHFAPTGPGRADGFYSYLFARSLAFDHDVDFRDDYELCGDPWNVGIDRGTGHPDNQAYAGPAVFWTPVVWIAKHVVSLPLDSPATAKAGCDGPIAVAALFLAVPLGALAVGLAYLVACRFASRRHAVFVALLFAVGSSLPHYATLWVSFSHVYECFACALLLWLSVRASESGRARTWALVGLGAALCTLMRLSDGAVALVPLAMVLGGALSRRSKAVAVALIAGGVAAGAGLTLALYSYLYGSPFVLPQGRHFLHLGHAHPLLLLFAPQGGLFYVTPIAYLAVLGVLVAVRDRRARAMATGAVLCIAIIVWVSSSALDWHGKGAFGARRLVVLVPIFIVLSAIAMGRIDRTLRKHRWTLGAAAALLLFGVPVVGATLATVNGELPTDGGSAQAVQYGSGVRASWAFLDARVGDLAILPAELIYASRFGLPMTSFRAATTDKFYRRSYRTMAWEPNRLDFSDSTLREASRGLAVGGAAARVVGTEATIVFAAEWPFATDATLELDATLGTRVALAMGTFFGRCNLEPRDVEMGDRRVLRWAIPPGCFDSGLVELKVRVTVPGAITIRTLTLDDTTRYPPPY